MTPHCPAPDLIVRVVHGDGTPEEIATLETHATRCPECRLELEALKTQGLAEAWSRGIGAGETLPEALWRGVAAARSRAGLSFNVRIGQAVDQWVRAITGGVELRTLGLAPVRGAATESSRVRAVASDIEVLLRRGPDRLTLVMTERGAPAEGFKLRLCGRGFDECAVTDSTGSATFRRLSGGDYRLDVEGIEP